MITVMIVEDEKVIREGLQKHVPWENWGIREVYAASQAEEALEMCRKVKPDIVVSDIRMPGMSGIDLCRKIREEYPECKIIFVTGFSDKEYLMAAIELQAVSYVEKPVNMKEISVAITNAVDQIRKTRVYEQAVVHSIFTKSDQLDYQWSNDTFFSVALLYFKEKMHEQKIQNGIGRKIEKAAQKEEFHTYLEMLNDRTLAILFSDVLSGKERMKAVKLELGKIVVEEEKDCFLAYGDEVNDQKMIKQSYQLAECRKRNLGHKGWNTVTDEQDIFCKLANSGLEKNIRSDFTTAMAKNDITEAEKIIKNLAEEIEKRKILLDMDLRYWFYDMENQICHMLGIKKAEPETGVGLEKLETVRELEQYLCELLKQEAAENKNYYIAQKVSEYIREHYGEKDLSIKTLAEAVYLTPTYLSNLYKKQTGITIGQYLVDVRVEQAILLLKDPQWKLYQIAPMVGYEDANYFAKIFKKKKGVTPSEYREKMVR